jgi:hypothetical protein
MNAPAREGSPFQVAAEAIRDAACRIAVRIESRFRLKGETRHPPAGAWALELSSLKCIRSAWRFRRRRKCETAKPCGRSTATA